jgi:uncharacterized membrane protein YeaQ/YmgE (transglycosylase-associated protein family)
MMSLEWALLIALAAGWFASMLMNRGEFDGNYFVAAFAGALLFPYLASLVAQYFNYAVPPSTFAGLQPRCAGAMIACLLFDGVKRLSPR